MKVIPAGLYQFAKRIQRIAPLQALCLPPQRPVRPTNHLFDWETFRTPRSWCLTQPPQQCACQHMCASNRKVYCYWNLDVNRFPVPGDRRLSRICCPPKPRLLRCLNTRKERRRKAITKAVQHLGKRCEKMCKAKDNKSVASGRFGDRSRWWK